MEEAENIAGNSIPATISQNNGALIASNEGSQISAVDKERIRRTRERNAKVRISYAYKQAQCEAQDASENKLIKVGACFYDEDLTDTQKQELETATTCASTGSASSEYANALINQTIGCLHGSDPATIVKNINAVSGALLSLNPQDEIEGMLCTRLLVLHDHYMNRMASAKDSKYIHQGEYQINSATKLMRLYNETLEALSRYRRKGEQRVTVQHQHVNVGNGGQAIVGGQINQGGGGHDKK